MTHKALEEYFHQIVNKQPETKETTMFEKTKMFFTQQIEKINSLLTKPQAFVEVTELLDKDYWAFEMRTGEWEDSDGITHPVKHSVVLEEQDGTWMDVLDRILDEMEKHYGYRIKDQVYYSVAYPHNEPYFHNGELPSGYGRMLNDEVLQQLLLAFPEVYEGYTFASPSKEVFK